MRHTAEQQASEWTNKANSSAYMAGHQLMKSGDVIWCNICGYFGTQRGRGLTQSCPGPTQVGGIGGRAQQLRRLRAGFHPKSGRRLQPAVHQRDWTREEARLRFSPAQPRQDGSEDNVRDPQSPKGLTSGTTHNHTTHTNHNGDSHAHAITITIPDPPTLSVDSLSVLESKLPTPPLPPGTLSYEAPTKVTSGHGHADRQRIHNCENGTPTDLPSGMSSGAHGDLSQSEKMIDQTTVGASEDLPSGMSSDAHAARFQSDETTMRISKQGGGNDTGASKDLSSGMSSDAHVDRFQSDETTRRLSKQDCGNDTGASEDLPSGTSSDAHDARFQSDEAILPPTLSSPAVQAGRAPGASGVFPVDLDTFKRSSSNYKQAMRRAKAKMLIDAIGDAGPSHEHDPASASEALHSGDGSSSRKERQPADSPAILAHDDEVPLSTIGLAQDEHACNE